MIAASPSTTPRAPRGHAPRPLLLLGLLAVAGFLAIFDTVVSISSLPLMRNPSALASAVLVLLFVWYRREGWPLQRGAQRWLLAFLLYTAVLQLIRGLLGGGFDIGRYASWAQVLVLAIIATDLSRDRRAFALVWGGVVGGILCMAVLGSLPIGEFVQEAGGRSGFAGVNLNRQGYWYALALVTVIWLTLAWWPRVGWRGVVLLAASVTLAVALVQTGSRGALLSAVVGTIVVLVLAFRSRNVSAYATVIPIALLAGAWYVADASIVGERLAATLAGEDFGARDSIAQHALELVASQPWFGYGPGFASDLGDARGMTRAISSHNSFLQVALAFGLPGLALWIGIVMSALLRAWRSWFAFRQPVGALFFALVMMSVAFGLVADLAFNKYFWLLVALAAQAPTIGREAAEGAPRGPGEAQRRGGLLSPRS